MIPSRDCHTKEVTISISSENWTNGARQRPLVTSETHNCVAELVGPLQVIKSGNRNVSLLISPVS
jgi:hypothetical protein